ncbi:30S ribosomal protein S3 [candidate division WWE3 bacterium RIFCSPLOWO2_01_FULL_53_14]|uniref:Small ribosomal subunit protein uS3 n=1 Tax=candidate division WWE3 bacterium RIFCSPLOWO2_01_FULL_53_14 TaxID=1802628 RepID=A0A1F4VRD8_UNCKA|nr:MAG: 30S ribosomal protein S3 [candidate division WWE3 bacterium RIFCSPLOWO2_01_FULL_53_14]
MGHKLNPKSLRTGIFLPWSSRWFSEKDYARFASEDARIRRFLSEKLREMGLESTEIERSGSRVKVTVTVAKPGLVIGRGGGGAELIKGELAKILKVPVELDVAESKSPATSASLLADRVISILERRGRQYRRVLNEVIEESISRGAKGVKIELAGRLGGSEIARNEKFSRGSIPLSTLRADVDFAGRFAATRYGKIGVKVWIFRGEIKKEDGIR